MLEGARANDAATNSQHPVHGIDAHDELHNNDKEHEVDVCLVVHCRSPCLPSLLEENGFLFFY